MDQRDDDHPPDEHLDPAVAAVYDRSVARAFEPASVEPAVETLARLAGTGVAVEFAIGTGRIALPLAAAGVAVRGIDFSAAMLSELAKKPGAGLIELVEGDMTTTRVCSGASLVFLVFNTITNLRTQAQQVACFHNAAAHLRPGGRFVSENGVPQLHRLAPGDTFQPFDVSPNHVGIEEYRDTVHQISVSHHYFIEGDSVRRVAGVFRCVWPSELDLMAQLAGLTLEARWEDWNESPFTAGSPKHVSLYRKP